MFLYIATAGQFRPAAGDAEGIVVCTPVTLPQDLRTLHFTVIMIYYICFKCKEWPPATDAVTQYLRALYAGNNGSSVRW